MDIKNFEIAVSVVAGVFLVLLIIIFGIVINLHIKVKRIIQNDNKSEHKTKVSRPQTKYEPAQQYVPRPDTKMIPQSSSNLRNTHQYQPDPQSYQPPGPQQMPKKFRRIPSNDYKTDDFNTPPGFNNRVERQNSDQNTPPLRDSSFRNPLGGLNKREMDNRFNYTDPRSLQSLNRPNTSDIGFRGMESQTSRPRELPMGNNYSMEPPYPRRELHY